MASSTKKVGIPSFVLIVFLCFNGITAQGEKPDNNNVSSHSKIVMCYIGTWARYRQGDGFFDASSFDPRLCTHVIYSFVGLAPPDYTIKSLDVAADLNDEEGGKDGFKSVVNLKRKNPHLKVLVAIGGWTQGSENYSAMASLPERRKVFVQSVTEFLNKYKFDGLDVDWEYPTQRGGKPEDKQNFVALLQELRSAFKKYNWILSVAVAAPFYIINEAYDVPQISAVVDFINVMTYDYHGKWDNKTGHNCPLYEGKDGFDKNNNMNATIQHYLKLGADHRKINIGLPFYGRTFLLDNPKDPTVGSAAHQAGPKGQWTQEAGFMGYNELCGLIADHWVKNYDRMQEVPYAYKDKVWISYDNEHSIIKKVDYAINKRLAGVMIWSIDMDDVKARCHRKSMHLLRKVNEVFAKAFNDSLNVVPQHMPDDDEDDGDYNEINTGHTRNNAQSYCRPPTFSYLIILVIWIHCFVRKH